MKRHQLFRGWRHGMPLPGSKTRKLVLESLESRVMADATVTVSRGVLTITGNALQQEIVVRQDSAGLVEVLDLGHLLGKFAPASVRNIKARLGAGSDILINCTKVPMTAWGGAGDDEMHGGAGNDSLAGEGGFDRLFGHGGTDRLNGGKEADEIFGGPGNDLLVGGPGGDDFSIGLGKDRIVDLNVRYDRVHTDDCTPGLPDDPFAPVNPGVTVIDWIDDHSGLALYQGSTVRMNRLDLGVSGIFYTLTINGELRQPVERRANNVITVRVPTLSSFTIDAQLRSELEAEGWLRVERI